MKKTRNTYICVSATNYSTFPSINTGHIFTSVKSCKLQIGNSLTYDEAKKQMVKLAVRYNLKIARVPNYYDPTIVTYEIRGFLD